MIELGQVHLRPLEPKDVAALYRYRNEWEVIRHLGGFSAGYSRRNLKEWIESHRNRADEVLWTIADARTDKCLGHVGLYQIDNRVRKAEFAILIGDRNAWGKGLGTTVTAAVLEWGFAQLNLHKISLTVLAANRRAIHVYRSLGFRDEGTLRHEQYRDGKYLDVLLMSVLEQEWRRQRKSGRR